MLAREGHLYDFGSFRLDLNARMLLRDGGYIAITPKAFETLVVLVESQGRIVDKEELLRLVWPGTCVEEATLAKTVSILRKALGEDEGHHYIDTVPKRGYRFAAQVRVADVAAIEEQTQAQSDSKPARAPVAPLVPLAPANAVRTQAGRFGRVVSSYRWLVVLLVFLVVAAATYAFLPHGNRSRTAAAPSKAVPLTSFPGRQNEVAFSPDGNQIAFVWDGPLGGNSHVYVKAIGSEALLQLTHDPGSDSRPAWSPDGRSVAFLRSTPESRAWYLTSVLGGAERKLADVFPYFDLGSGNSAYFSQDSKTLAIVDKAAPAEPSSIFLLPVEGSTRRQLTFPPAATTGDYYPAFSPDGKWLAFARAVSFSATDLYVLDLPGGKPKRLTFDGLTIEGLAWTFDSREIIFSSRRGGSFNSLWRIGIHGGTPERVSAFGEDVISPAVSRDGGRLAYTRRLDDMNIWRFTLDAAGRVISKAPLIASTFRDSDPDYSPDGRRIAFTSGRNGSFGIWVSDSDGANPRLLFDGGAYVTGSPRWSPDGRRIVFDTRANDPAKVGNPSVWMVDADGGQLHRVTDATTGDVAPSWSHDGGWVYFASTRSGNLQIWKIPAQGGQAIQVTRRGGFEGFESADGRFLLYVKGREVPGIWRVPTAGGEEVPVTDRDQVGYWRCWRVARDGIYFATATPPAGPRMEYLDLTSGAIRQIALLPKPPDATIPGLAVSPDGRQLLLAQYDQNGSNIIMVERTH
ncbi:MAG TPA: winged helix-turn-helix domain-containing protein [Bryobacteraceae bacterium]|nr:winged helix-turn-helix domain-containing protein [Bryobacteraceae bacterium]